MAPQLHIDFETRSTVDLKSAGLDNYAKFPTTSVWCIAFAFDDEPVDLIDYYSSRNIARVLAHVKSGGIVLAHNAAFELAIWNNILVPRSNWPPLKPEQMRCTMAMAYAMGLPGALDNAASAVGLDVQKDRAGYRLMLQMCRPRGMKSDGSPIWWDEPEKLERLFEYCKQDVRTERALAKRLLPLSDDEQALWVLDRKINDRGVMVDRLAVKAALKLVQVEQVRLNAEMRDLTDGHVGACTEVARLTSWLRGKGVVIEGVAKAHVLDALSGDDLPPDCRKALLLRRESAKSSTAKLHAMSDAVSADDRLRNMFQYHGAHTGRWAGRRVQLQNIPRWPEGFGAKDAEVIFGILTGERDASKAARRIDVIHGAPLTIVSYLLRSMLTAAPRHTLMAADFANIESRGLAWLAGDDQKLDDFRAYDAGEGPDIYRLAASAIEGIPIAEVTKAQRQIGKVSELACGFGGGVRAFQKMARNYGVTISDDKAEAIKIRWRELNTRTVGYWYDLERVAIQAVLRSGQVVSVGPKERAVSFRVKGSFLWCRLPSGRVLAYPYPCIKPKETPWGELKDQLHYKTRDGLTRKWAEVSTYGGKLAENVTQAICRDLLVYAIRQAEAAGYPIVLHVHDELVTEFLGEFGSLPEFEAICSRKPGWAEGLPVVAKGWVGRRYRK